MSIVSVSSLKEVLSKATVWVFYSPLPNACSLPNRNGQLNQVEIEEYLKSTFYLQKILWLDHGYLAGDDTDSHIDTLARFCSTNTIAYVKCENKEDEHYEALRAMEEQLKTFRTLAGEPYRLLALPMAGKIEEDVRTPACNLRLFPDYERDVILYPTYNQPANDKKQEKYCSKPFQAIK